MKQQKSVIGDQTQNYTQITFSNYLEWTGCGGGTIVLVEVLSSNTGLSIEYTGGGDFLIFMLEKLRITEFVRKHFFLPRFWAIWNNKI